MSALFPACELGPHRAIFLCPTEDSHNDRHRRVFQISQGRMTLSRKRVNKVGLGIHSFRVLIMLEYTGCEYPDKHPDKMPNEQDPSP